MCSGFASRGCDFFLSTCRDPLVLKKREQERRSAEFLNVFLKNSVLAGLPVCTNVLGFCVARDLKKTLGLSRPSGAQETRAGAHKSRVF